MTRNDYRPGPANIAHVQKDGEDWTLVLVRNLSHSPEKVWQALTEPDELRGWAPFDADKSLGTAGTKVKLSTVGAPSSYETETTITRAEAPRLLEFRWGENDTLWELEPNDQGTRLTLWTRIDRRYMAMGAAGWQVCFDVLDNLLDGTPIGRIVASDALKFEGWQCLHADYSKQFGIEMPSW